MAWTDRLKEAAYTSAVSRTRVTFAYEDVRKTVDKRTSAFEFPDVDGTYIQDLGRSGRRYPLRLFYWGADYDLQADAFEEVLLEQGAGVLEHPIYGQRDVVPFGSITRRNNLKTGANQAVLEVTFYETTELAYPNAQGDPSSAVVTAVEEYNAALAEQYANSVTVDSAPQRSRLQAQYQTLLDGANAALAPIVKTQDNVRRQYEAIRDSINQGIDTLVADPLTLAFQTTQLLQAPARAVTDITARLSAYADLTAALISGDGAATPNDLYTADLYASTYTTGSVLSAVNNTFTTKAEALEAVDAILTQFDSLTAWRDSQFGDLEEIDTGDSYRQLQEAVALTAGFLVEISFSLKQERRITLDRNRNLVELVAELYGSIDDRLDFFINSNELTGSEIIELPRGREIGYYI